MPKELKEKIEALLLEAGRPVDEALLAGEGDAGLPALLDELQPYDIATLLPDLPSQQQLELLELLAPAFAAEALEHLEYDEQYRLLDHIDEPVVHEVLSAMSTDGLADLVAAVHPRQAHQLMRRLPEHRAASIRGLMEFPGNSAGGIMTLSYIAVRESWTCDRVIGHFRKVGRGAEVANYLYVVAQDGSLEGVSSLREVLLAPPQTPVREIMYNQVVYVQAQLDQEEAARVLGRYDLVALPVVDEKRRLVGVITADDVIDVIEEEATEDIQISGGVQPLAEPYLRSSFFDLFRKRIGWLLILFVAESLTSNILHHYESVLNQVVALTFFIPLLIGTGGNSGSQASTLVIRAMALGEVTMKDFIEVVWKEARLGLALGLCMATVAFGRAYWLGGDPKVGLTVAGAIALVVVVGSTIGAVLPLVGKRLNLDPAVFSAPLITTVVDAAGLVIYLSMARLILGLHG